MRVGNGRTDCGRNCVRGEEFNYYLKGLARAPWILEGRNGLARGIYNRLVEGDWFSEKQILAEAQGRLNALISGRGFSA